MHEPKFPKQTILLLWSDVGLLQCRFPALKPTGSKNTKPQSRKQNTKRKTENTTTHKTQNHVSTLVLVAWAALGLKPQTENGWFLLPLFLVFFLVVLLSFSFLFFSILFPNPLTQYHYRFGNTKSKRLLSAAVSPIKRRTSISDTCIRFETTTSRSLMRTKKFRAADSSRSAAKCVYAECAVNDAFLTETWADFYSVYKRCCLLIL